MAARNAGRRKRSGQCCLGAERLLARGTGGRVQASSPAAGPAPPRDGEFPGRSGPDRAVRGTPHRGGEVGANPRRHDGDGIAGDLGGVVASAGGRQGRDRRLADRGPYRGGTERTGGLLRQYVDAPPAGNPGPAVRVGARTSAEEGPCRLRPPGRAVRAARGAVAAGTVDRSSPLVPGRAGMAEQHRTAPGPAGPRRDDGTAAHRQREVRPVLQPGTGRVHRLRRRGDRVRHRPLRPRHGGGDRRTVRGRGRGGRGRPEDHRRHSGRGRDRAVRHHPRRRRTPKDPRRVERHRPPRPLPGTAPRALRGAGRSAPGRHSPALGHRHHDLRRAEPVGEPRRLGPQGSRRRPGGRRRRRCPPRPGHDRRRPGRAQGGRRLSAARTGTARGPRGRHARRRRVLPRAVHAGHRTLGPAGRRPARRNPRRPVAGRRPRSGTDRGPGQHGVHHLHLRQHREAQGRRGHPPTGAQPDRLVLPHLRVRPRRRRPLRHLARLRPLRLRHLRPAGLRRRCLHRGRRPAARPAAAPRRSAHGTDHLLGLRAHHPQPGRLPAHREGRVRGRRGPAPGVPLRRLHPVVAARRGPPGVHRRGDRQPRRGHRGDGVVQLLPGEGDRPGLAQHSLRPSHRQRPLLRARRGHGAVSRRGRGRPVHRRGLPLRRLRQPARADGGTFRPRPVQHT
ncbi:hypothetical protein SNARM312S_07241 [Streptomyces narbonensis]